MRSKNPEVMNAICTFVDQYYREHHASPSVNSSKRGHMLRTNGALSPF